MIYFVLHVCFLVVWFLFTYVHHKSVSFFYFFCCYAATQLALSLRQQHLQVVCSNKEVWKRLPESNGTPAMDLDT